MEIFQISPHGKYSSFLQFTLFVAKLRFMRFCMEKIEPKIVPVEFFLQISGTVTCSAANI